MGPQCRALTDPLTKRPCALFRRFPLCLARIPEGHQRPAASQPRIPGQQAGSEWAVPGRASPEAALSGLGRRASRRRDAHTRRAGSATGTVGTALPRRVRPYVSRRTQDASVPDRLEATGMSAPAAQPLGTSPVPTRPDPTRGGSPCPGVPADFGRPALCGVHGSRTHGSQPLGVPLRRHRVVPGAGSEETGSRPHCGSTPREKGRARDRNAKRGLGLVAETRGTRKDRG